MTTALPREGDRTTVAVPPPGSATSDEVLASGAERTCSATVGGVVDPESVERQTAKPPMARMAAVAAATSQRSGLPGPGESRFAGGDVTRFAVPRHEGRQRTDGRDPLEHLGPQTRRRCRVAERREGGCGRRQARHLRLTGGAPGKVLLELCPLAVVEGVNGVCAGERVDVVAHEVTPNVSRSLMSPSRMRVFAVPRGRSSIVATSVCV